MTGSPWPTGSPLVRVVGHDATLTGAPNMLLSMLRRQPPEVTVQLDLLGGGPLEGAFEQIVGRVRTRSAAERSFLEAFGTTASIPSPGPGRARPDIVVANTLAASRWAVAATPRGSTLVCHVHELDGVAERVLPTRRRGRVIDRVDRFIAAGPAVEAMLTDRWGVETRRVHALPEAVEPPERARWPQHGSPDETGADSVARVRRHARRSLGIPTDAAVVISVGACSPRKGADRFVDLLASIGGLRARSGVEQPLHGVWVGCTPDGTLERELALDARRSDRPVSLHLIPSTTDVDLWLGTADLCVGVAREDPYPLALLEAAIRGVPVVTFASGGAADLIASTTPDRVVPAGDIASMARVAERLLRTRDETTADLATERLRRHVKRTHTADVIAPRWWGLVLAGVDPDAGGRSPWSPNAPAQAASHPEEPGTR
ncbi:MAG: glycosyltransferase family 4 protein [Microthrixaceae bacterium]